METPDTIEQLTSTLDLFIDEVRLEVSATPFNSPILLSGSMGMSCTTRVGEDGILIPDMFEAVIRMEGAS